ncbi:MAG TPA: metalloregulator ArsR/SmtB family transcription factor [Bacteroidia bacterium]|nr:metalloregulator ArsR/SmtB family transcription factor [Bacteroidia bacterium]
MGKKKLICNTKHDANKLAEMVKSIAHPERLQILSLLFNCGCDKLSVKNIYQNLKLEQPIVSRHLGIMKRAGLLKEEVDGRNTYYCLNIENPTCNCLDKMLKS